MSMINIDKLLRDFWEWAGISSEEYASSVNTDLEPFYYPLFSELRESCKDMINTSLNGKEMDAFLTCMALDEEEETILDWCKNIANDSFIEALVYSGCHHAQPNARWQIAELLRCRNVPNRKTVLAFLTTDSHYYVRKRAQNAIQFIHRQS